MSTIIYVYTLLRVVLICIFYALFYYSLLKMHMFDSQTSKLSFCYFFDINKNQVYYNFSYKLILDIELFYIYKFGQSAMQAAKDIRSLLSAWLSDQTSVQIFILFISTDEAELEQLCNSDLLNVRIEKTKEEFLKWVSQNSADIFRDFPSKEEIGQGRTLQDQLGNLKSELKEYIQNLQIQANKKNNIDSLFQIELNKYFNQLAISKLKNKGEVKQEAVEKFYKTFSKIERIYNIKQDRLAELVLQNGIHQLYRIRNINDRQRDSIKKTIQLMKSCKSLRSYGGKDINKIKKEVQKQLQECLLGLELPLHLIEEIKLEMLQNPTSNFVATHKQLPAQTKERFFSSVFYKSNILLEYSQILHYPQTLHARAMKEVSNLTQLISSKYKISKQIIDMISNFELEKILKHEDVQHFKKNIFVTAKNKCPNFLKASLLIKYLNKQPSSFRQSQKLEKMFQLRTKFLQVGLRFQDWQSVQYQLFSRNDSVIHYLELTLQKKNELRVFYNKTIQSYFHQKEKPYTYEQQIREILLNQLMQLKLEKGKDLDTIYSLIDLVINLNHLQQTEIDIEQLNNIEQLNKSEKKQLVNALRKNQQLLTYMKRKGINQEEIQYQACQKIKQLIYQINIQNQIEVSIRNINQFLELFKRNRLVIPLESNNYICDIKQLTKRYKEEGGEGPSQQELDQYDQQRLKELKESKKPTVQKYINDQAKQMNDQEVQCQIIQQKCVNQQIKILQHQEMEIEFEVQSVPQSPIKLTIKSELKSSQKQQISSDSKQKVQPILSSPAIIFNREEQIEKLKRQMNHIELQFLKSYEKLNELQETLFNKNLIDKNSDKKDEIVRKILQANPFEHDDATFYDGLKKDYKLNKHQANNIQKQFKNKAAEFGKSLAKRYQDIIICLKKLN